MVDLKVKQRQMRSDVLSEFKFTVTVELRQDTNMQLYIILYYIEMNFVQKEHEFKTI